MSHSWTTCIIVEQLLVKLKLDSQVTDLNTRSNLRHQTRENFSRIQYYSVILTDKARNSTFEAVIWTVETAFQP